MAGSLYCGPVFMDFDGESGMTFEKEPTFYGVAFSFANDALRKVTTAANSEVDEDGRCYWMDSRQLSVNDTVQDKLVNVVLVKLTAIGMDDVVVALGQVPVEKLATIYS